MLSNSPGSVGFESAPFKLTQEYVDVLGGALSPEFEKFRALFKQAFQGKYLTAFPGILVSNFNSTIFFSITKVSRQLGGPGRVNGQGISNAVFLVWGCVCHHPVTATFPTTPQ